jgi:hypothetical protein
MDIKTKEIYSEVYSVLNLLGDSYIKKLPTSLYNMIQEERLETYTPTYNSIIALEQQDIKRETLSMIALFHLNYWCNSDEEKKELREMFRKNDEEHQAELREKYNPDNLFKKKEQTVEEKEIKQENMQLIEYKEENIFKKILNRIMKFFKKNN